MSIAKVLVVDDEPDLREILVDELKEHGLDVSQAASGNEAWALLQKVSFKVILSDIRMPQGDGISLLKNIRSANLTQPPIVFLFSGFSDVTEAEAKRLGAQHVFAKPFDLNMIAQAVLAASI